MIRHDTDGTYEVILRKRDCEEAEVEGRATFILPPLCSWRRQSHQIPVNAGT
jgi:hypothetical protein